MDWKVFGNWVLVAAALLAFLFAILYSFTAPWYKSAIGRSLFGVLSSLAGGMVYFGWSVHHSPLPRSFYPLRALIFSAIAASVGASVILLARAQWGGHPKREKDADEVELEEPRQVDSDGASGGSDGRRHRLPRGGE